MVIPHSRSFMSHVGNCILIRIQFEKSNTPAFPWKRFIGYMTNISSSGNAIWNGFRSSSKKCSAFEEADFYLHQRLLFLYSIIYARVHAFPAPLPSSISRPWGFWHICKSSDLGFRLCYCYHGIDPPFHFTLSFSCPFLFIVFHLFLLKSITSLGCWLFSYNQ